MNNSLWLTTALLTLAALPALATTGKVYQDADGAVFIYDLTPGAKVRFGVDAPPSRRLTTDACGTLNVSQPRRYPRSTIQINGQVINPDTLTTRIRPPCRRQDDGSYSLDEARSEPFLNSRNGSMLVPNLMPNTRYEFTYPGLYRLITRKVNACGFLRVRETNTVNFNDFLLLPTSTRSTLAEFRISEIPVLQGLICYRSNLYYPANWTGWPEITAVAGSEVSESAISDAGIASSPSGSLVGASSGGTSGDSTGGDGSSDNTGPDPAMYEFTEATYNASLHDYNGDGLVDDADGDGIPDDRDGDGQPDGPWGPDDIVNSAGPGRTPPSGSGVGPSMNIGIQGIDAVCFGYDGSLVAVDSGLQRGQQYRLEGDDWSSSAHSNATAGGHPGGDPTIRFEHPQGQSYNQPKYTTAFGMEANGYIVDGTEEPRFMFNMQNVQSCMVPPWLNP